MIKKLNLAAAAIALTLVSCSKESVAAAGDLAKGMDIDVSSLSAEALTEKVPDLLKNVTGSLGKITDLASAKDIVGKVAPMLTTLTGIKDKLGTAMPDLSSLGDMVTGLKDKFGGDSGIMDILKPILEKITGLMG